MANPTLQTRVKAEAIKSAFSLAVGIEPTVLYTPDGKAKILFSQPQILKIQEAIEKAAATKGDIDVNILPIIGPLLLKKSAPFLAAGLAASFFGGYFIGKK